MCGIAGVLRLDGRPAARAELRPMVRALAHRGPDDEGFFEAGPVALGHRRLSIVDLSAAGHQPMIDRASGAALVYNGEIYNHAEIRRELERAGQRFRSRSDTEVLLRGLVAWGAERLLPRLNGMFAFAWWDGEKLLLVRDRLGIKPLYTARTGDRFLFASELKALVAHPEFHAELDPVALHHYLAFYVVPQPHTLLRGAAALPPAHRQEISAAGIGTARRWWSPPREGEQGLDHGRWCERLRAALERSVRRRKMADVPVGAFLSGGTDSSAVVALMSEVVEGPLHTFSIGFGAEGAELDELPHARAVAERWGTRHRERRLSGDDVAKALARIVWQMDEPAGFALCNYFVSELAREAGVPVVLSGLGGDELFAGYERHQVLLQRERLFRRFARLPGFLRGASARRLAARLPVARAGAFLRQAALSPAQRNAGYKFGATHEERRALYAPPLATLCAEQRTEDLVLPHLERGSDPVDAVLRADLHTYLPNDLLRHMDSLSMAFSIEARVPLLDHELVELAATMPTEHKIRAGELKAVLKDAVADLIPESALRRAKQGFNFPMHKWMHGPLRPIVEAALDPELVARRGLFRPAAVAELLAAFRGARTGVGVTQWWIPQIRVWSLVVLELWMRLYLDRAAPEGPPEGASDGGVEELLREPAGPVLA